MSSFSLSRVLSESSFKKIFALWFFFIILFSGIFYSLSLTDGERNYLLVNEEKELGYFQHLIFSAFLGLKFDNLVFEPIGSVMKFLAILHMLISTILICTMISKFILSNITTRIENLQSSKMRKRSREILAELRKLKQDFRKSSIKKASLLYKINLEELKKYTLEKEVLNDFVGITTDIFEIMLEKNITDPKTIDQLYFISNLSEDIIQGVKESEEKELAIDRIKDWKVKIVPEK